MLMLKSLEANVSSSHAVAQFVLVPDERHEAHIDVDVDLLIQDQDTIGLPRDWLHGMDFLCCIPELLTKVLDLWTRKQDDQRCNTEQIYCYVCSSLAACFGRGVAYMRFSEFQLLYYNKGLF